MGKRTDEISRRGFLKRAGIAGAVVAGSRVGSPGMAWGAEAVEERLVNAGKALKKKVELNALVWGQYLRGQSQKLANDFKEKTGIGIGGTMDVNPFVMAQKAMAEAVARSGKFDLIHVDLNMVPTLVNAGMLEPLNKHMERVGYKYESVGPMTEMSKYHGETYGLITDGNVYHLQIRKDYFENPEERKKFEDKHGRPMKWPDTWEEYNELVKFFTRPGTIWGSGDLRARLSGGSWWFYMMFYSKGGFFFADDMNPTIYNEAGVKAAEEWVATKAAATPDMAQWGTPQNIPFIIKGNVFAVNYWPGLIQLSEAPASPTKGKWLYGVVPGSRVKGRLIKRSCSAPLSGWVVNKLGQNPEAAALLAMYLTTVENSARVVGDDENAFHDPWRPEHFRDKVIASKYVGDKGGIAALQKCIQITTPAIYLPGYQEFYDILDKNLADAFVGTITPEQAMKKTDEEWKGAIKRIGAKRLATDLPTYKAAFPKVDVPA